MIVTCNKPFSAWGEIFGDDMAATAMIDRLIHHSEILSPQRRQLPATRQRPRHPDRRQTRRNRLTDHPRDPRRGPQNAAQRPDPLAQSSKRPDPGAPHATPAAFRLRSPTAAPREAAAHPQKGSILNPAQPSSGLVSTGADTRGWDTFQPAQVGHFSTGLDKDADTRPC